MTHRRHPTSHGWFPDCSQCHVMECRDCGHPRPWHSHGQGCLMQVAPFTPGQHTYCTCGHKKGDTAAFIDPAPSTRE